jgi:hypothetical protein
MDTPLVILLSRHEIEEHINNCILYGSKYMSNIRCEQIKNNIKHVWKDIKQAIPETYVFLGEDINTKQLFGLYKTEQKTIYIVKSFLNTIIAVVPFHRKYFEDELC